MDFKEYLNVFQERVDIYKRWNLQLKEFLEKREFEPYNEIVILSTQKLRDLREKVKEMVFCDESLQDIKRIEEIEDNHLRVCVEYHRNKISGLDCSNIAVQDIEAEIMDLVQEIINNTT